MHTCANSTVMALTEKQIISLSKLSMDDQIDIVLNCAENLGLMPVSEYAEIMQINRRDVYRMISNNTLRHIKISNIILVLINY